MTNFEKMTNAIDLAKDSNVPFLFVGNPGEGKTTIAKSMLYNLRLKYPEKSFLVVDNDLTTEFGFTFGHSVRETVYGIRSGKHEYKTGIPEGMSKQEFIEWALEDIIVSVDEKTLTVKGLDAIDGTMVLDIKTYYPVYDKKDAKVPEWGDRLMEHYF